MLLIPFAIVLFIITITVYVLLFATFASEALPLSIIIAVLVFVIISVCIVKSVKKSKQANKPYYFIPIVVALIIGLALLVVFKNDISEFFYQIYQPIGPGSLPNNSYN